MAAFFGAALLVEPVVSAELEDRTARAFETYRQQAEARFLARAQTAAASRGATVSARPAGEDGIISVPGGLVHHWAGVVFFSGANLREVVALSQDYAAYPSIYREILSSRVVEHEGDTYRLATRLKEGEAGITAVLDVRSTVRYAAGSSRVYVLSNSDSIQEVRNAGQKDERLLPPGRDSGYLWRAAVYTLFVESSDGVSMEVETLGLSRAFPRLMGWFIEPIARRLGRKSVVRSLEQFQAALAQRAVTIQPSMSIRRSISSGYRSPVTASPAKTASRSAISAWVRTSSAAAAFSSR